MRRALEQESLTQKSCIQEHKSCWRAAFTDTKRLNHRKTQPSVCVSVCDGSTTVAAPPANNNSVTLCEELSFKPDFTFRLTITHVTKMCSKDLENTKTLEDSGEEHTKIHMYTWPDKTQTPELVRSCNFSHSATRPHTYVLHGNMSYLSQVQSNVHLVVLGVAGQRRALPPSLRPVNGVGDGVGTVTVAFATDVTVLALKTRRECISWGSWQHRKSNQTQAAGEANGNVSLAC